MRGNRREGFGLLSESPNASPVRKPGPVSAERIRTISRPSPAIPSQVPNADRPPALQRVSSGFSGDNSHPQTARFNRCCSAPQELFAFRERYTSRHLDCSAQAHLPMGFSIVGRHQLLALISTQPRGCGLHRASTVPSYASPSDDRSRVCSCVTSPRTQEWRTQTMIRLMEDSTAIRAISYINTLRTLLPPQYRIEAFRKLF